MTSHHVVVRPIITEKSVRLKEDANQVVFAVRLDASKIEIRHAIEELFKVRVLSVRTARMTGKVKRVGRRVRVKPDWKKAMIELRAGDTIEFFEQA